MTGIDNTLNGRGNEHGEFKDHAYISQQLKLTMQKAPNYYGLPPDMRESLDMIQHKIARILNGNPKHIDSWHDIQGYARLIERDLLQEEEQ